MSDLQRDETVSVLNEDLNLDLNQEYDEELKENSEHVEYTDT
jgi:hypothetical protein